MFDKKRAVPVALALSSGMVTCGLLYAFLANQPKATAAPLTSEPMVVAAHPLDDAQHIQPGDLRVVNVPKRPDGAFASVKELEGRMPIVEVPAGQPLLSSHLAEPGTETGLWFRIEPGKRAITVAVNEVVGVGGFITPGRHVDIIGVKEQNQTWQSNTLVQNVPVLAIAQEDREEKGKAEAKVVTSATLMVTPEEAEKISLAGEQGRIRLVLRAPNDDVVRKVAPPKVAVKSAPAPVRRASRAAAPARAPEFADAGVQVIRGRSMEIVHP